jgi:hypothetical protein
MNTYERGLCLETGGDTVKVSKDRVPRLVEG